MNGQDKVVNGVVVRYGERMTPIHVLTYRQYWTRSRAIVAVSAAGIERTLGHVFERQDKKTQDPEVRVLGYHVGRMVDKPKFWVDLERLTEYRERLYQFRWEISRYAFDLEQNGLPLPEYLQRCPYWGGGENEGRGLGRHSCEDCRWSGYVLIGRTLEELYEANEAARRDKR